MFFLQNIHDISPLLQLCFQRICQTQSIFKGTKLIPKCVIKLWVAGLSQRHDHVKDVGNLLNLLDKSRQVPVQRSSRNITVIWLSLLFWLFVSIYNKKSSTSKVMKLCHVVACFFRVTFLAAIAKLNVI